MPKIDLLSAPVVEGSDYPAPYAAGFAERRRVKLGEAGGIAAFGVNLTTLPPGAASSLRHWHEVEEEMVYVVAGEVVLVEEAGETVLGPGDAAAFPAGRADGHHLVNRTERPATYLEIGTRPAEDRCHYSDVDLICHEAGGRSWFTRADGTPLEEEER